MTKRFPEEHDFVAVTVKYVDYFGYVDQIDYDLRDPRIKIEFYPGFVMWVGLDEIRFVDFPEESI